MQAGDAFASIRRAQKAVRLQLATGAEVVLGPGALLEIVGLRDLHLLQGECLLRGSKDQLPRIAGPNAQSIAPEKTQAFAIREAHVIGLPDSPAWLEGFLRDGVDESLGSLVATVDGHGANLSLGYHTVSVDIRDQVAETVIEESFVNSTQFDLEGVFSFPLPANASISDLAMWINGQLVEADVVEKQYARQVFESILRRRRDPALLEWSGGNLFKARVFPIPAQGRKANQNRLHASVAFAGRRLSLFLRLA